MNIVMMTNMYYPFVSGVTHSVRSFTEEFRRQGHRVTVISPELKNLGEEEEEGVIWIPSIKNIGEMDISFKLPVPHKLYGMIKNMDIDIIHSHHPFLIGSTAVRLASEKNVPLVYTAHTLYDKYVHYLHGADKMEKFFIDLTVGYCGLCSHIIAPGSGMRENLLRWGVRTPISVIPTGVEPEITGRKKSADFRKTHSIPEKCFVIGYAGRLAPEKNMDFITSAAAGFLKKKPGSYFLVLGSGPFEREMLKRFNSEKVIDRVRFAGMLTGMDLADGYASMDVLMFASKSETQGLVLAEALANGVPAVALDGPGITDTISSRHNGFIINSDSLDEFIGALSFIAEMPCSGRKKLSINASKSAEQFSIKACAEKMLSLYASLTSEKRTQAGAGSRLNELARKLSTERRLAAIIKDAAKKSANFRKSTLCRD